MIVDEGWRSGSISAEIGMRITEDAFFQLEMPLRALAAAAIALRGGGLIAPAIRNADKKSLTELMGAMRDLIERARRGGCTAPNSPHRRLP